MIQILHATDIHWFCPPTPGQLLSKRALGMANLYLRDRKSHFSRTVQARLCERLKAMEADALVISGDLTALATTREFELAHHHLAPALSRRPSLVINGNHDVYTSGAARTDRIATSFGTWLHRVGDGVSELTLPGITLLGLEVCRPHLTASGLAKAPALQRLVERLNHAPADHAVLLTLHYPLVGRDGEPYDEWEHGLWNAREVIDAIGSASRPPSAIVHGHVHHGYRQTIRIGDQEVPQLNPGSSGYAWMPEKHRAACFNRYTFEGTRLAGVERFRFDGEDFAVEPGGPYATGR